MILQAIWIIFNPDLLCLETELIDRPDLIKLQALLKLLLSSDDDVIKGPILCNSHLCFLTITWISSLSMDSKKLEKYIIYIKMYI